MTQTKQKGEFWRYVLPSMASQVLNSLFIVVDGFFIGQNLGNVGLAAINVAWPIVAVIQSVGLAIGMGSAVYFAMAKGRGEPKKATLARGNAIVLLGLASLVLGVVLYATYPVILPLIGGKDELYAPAAEYIRMVCLLAGVQLYCSGLLPLMRGMGATMVAMVSMMLGLGTNILLDWMFIDLFQWGVTGVALATVLAQALSVGICLWVVFRQKDMPVQKEQFRLDKRLVRRVAQYGVSPFGLSVSSSVILVCTNLQALKYGGTNGVAIYAVLSYIVGSVVPLLAGVGDGLQPLVSFAKGANLPHRLRQLRRSGLAMVVAVACAASLGCWLLRWQLPVLFGADPAVVGKTANAIWTLCLAYPFVGVLRFYTSYFTATGRTYAASALAYGEPLVAQPLCLLVLPLLCGLTGVWLAYPAATGIMALVALCLALAPNRKKGGESPCNPS